MADSMSKAPEPAMSLDAALKDIADRNAGKPVLTIWDDGSYVVHGALDAEISSRCEPALLDLDIETMLPVIFRTRDELQDSIRLHEKMLFTRAGAKQ